MLVLRAFEGTTARWSAKLAAAAEELLLMREFVRWGRTAAVRRVLFEAAVAKALDERAGRSRNMVGRILRGSGERGE